VDTLTNIPVALNIGKPLSGIAIGGIASGGKATSGLAATELHNQFVS
jgi:hypothetical protein